MSFLRRGGARPDRAEPPAEAFTRDLFTGRLARPAVAVGLVALGVAVAWVTNAVAMPVGIAAGIGVSGAVLGALLVMDRQRWHGQDVVLWQQAGRERRWREDTGRESPIRHPAQAETWLGVHPRGSVPPVYRVMASALAQDPVAHERELAAWNPSSDTEAAWKAWAIAAPLTMGAEGVDLGPVREAVDVLPEGDERRELEAGLAVAEALGRHNAGDATWLDPLLSARGWMRRERLRVAQRARLWLGRVGILLSFLVPAVALAASGLGAPEPFPPAFLHTMLGTRGDVGEVDDARLLRAFSGLATQVGSSAPLSDEPLSNDELDHRIGGGLPTVIWQVDTIDLEGPDGVGCDHVWSIETLLARDQAGGPLAIVTCDEEDGRAFLVPVDPATVNELRAGVGLPVVP